jgi:hypothetical protein
MLFFALGEILNLMKSARERVETIRPKVESDKRKAFVDSGEPWRSA